MEFVAFGDQAILINFEQKIDATINAKLIGLKKAIEKAKLAGVTASIPAYCSLTVNYDSRVIDFTTLCNQINSLKFEKQDTTKVRKIKIPVCYEGELAPDFPEVMQQTGLSKKEIIELHTSNPFRVYMLGFLPGFPYLGKLPEALFCERKPKPRLKVPQGSVGLAGFQTGIYPAEAPGGWQIIGQTPIPVFGIGKEKTFLLKAGDLVRFEAVSFSNFTAIRKDLSNGNFDLNLLYDQTS